MLCVPIPEQHHALCQAAHQQVGVGVAIHVQPSAESVAKGLHAGRAQLCPTDHLLGGEALLTPCKWGLQPPYPFLWGVGGSKPGWGCAAVLRRCCGRCTLCLAPQREPPQRCLGVHGGGGSAPQGWRRAALYPLYPQHNAPFHPQSLTPSNLHPDPPQTPPPNPTKVHPPTVPPQTLKTKLSPNSSSTPNPKCPQPPPSKLPSNHGAPPTLPLTPNLSTDPHLPALPSPAPPTRAESPFYPPLPPIPSPWKPSWLMSPMLAMEKPKAE